jgi:hypothetical protein
MRRNLVSGFNSVVLAFSERSLAKNDFMHIRGVDPLERLAFDKLHEGRRSAADYMRVRVGGTHGVNRDARNLLLA